MKIRSWLMGWRFWRRYRRHKKQFRQLQRQLKDSVAAYEAKLTAQKSFYELRIARLTKRAELREDALLDRVLQAHKLMGVGHSTINIKENLELPPGVENPEKAQPAVFVEYDISADQKDFVEAYRRNFFDMGFEAGRSEAEIQAVWESQEYENAVDQAIHLIPE